MPIKKPLHAKDRQVLRLLSEWVRLKVISLHDSKQIKFGVGKTDTFDVTG
jgi:hypothetical protein